MRRTSISGKRPTNSEENIVRTDVIELSYTNKGELNEESNNATTSINSSLVRKASTAHRDRDVIDYDKN